MSKFNAWLQQQAPTRDSFERSRFLRPFAQRVFHPALWRFTRRSVPRGVALGLLVGIFLLIPGVQIAGGGAFGTTFQGQYSHRRSHDLSEHACYNSVYLVRISLRWRVRASLKQWVGPLLPADRDVRATFCLG